MKNLNTHKNYLLRKVVRIKNIGWISKLIRYLKRLVIPGFQGVPFWEVMKFFLESVFKGVLFQRAAAMTYNIFMALIPMLMALIATLSFLGDSLQQYLINFIQSILPDNAWEFVSQILNDLIQRQNNTIFWLSLGLGVYLTFICINSIINSLNITYFKMSRAFCYGATQLPLARSKECHSPFVGQSKRLSAKSFYRYLRCHCRGLVFAEL